MIVLWGDKPLYPPTAVNASINVHWDAPTVPAEAVPASLRVNTVTIAPAATASFVRALRTRKAAWIALPGLPEETLVFPVGLSGSNAAIGEALAKCAVQAERLEYIAQIRDRIKRNWVRPPGVAPGLEANVRIVQIPGGEVVKVQIVTSSGNVAFDRSIEEAVLRSSPLPLPKDPSLFDRRIVLAFKPEA